MFLSTLFTCIYPLVGLGWVGGGGVWGESIHGQIAAAKGTYYADIQSHRMTFQEKCVRKRKKKPLQTYSFN